MALQTRDLWMIALGLEGDVPPNGLQPPLPDGMHLRWAFAPAKGFPWFGYYLFRRPSRREQERFCITRYLERYKPGLLGNDEVSVGFGTLSSDRPLRFTDDFPAPGMVEVDLAQRTYVRYEPPPGEPVYQVEATIGFRGRTGEGERVCAEFSDPVSTVPNPLNREGARLTSFRHDGTPAPVGRLMTLGGQRGWDTGFHAEIQLPCPSDRVDLVLAHSSSAPRVTAFDRAGVAVDAATMTGNGPEVITLTGQGILSVRIDAPQDETILLSVCWVCERTGRGDDGRETAIPIEARWGGGLVASEVVTGRPGDVRSVVLTADAIDRVDIGPGEAALIDLCVTSVRAGARTGGWDRLEGFEYPLCLPVAHGDYPCPSAPGSHAGAEALALGRITYGAPAAWSGASFDSVHERLERLVDGGPPPAGESMYDRSEPVAGSPPPPPEVGGAITQQRQRPLELLLLGSLHPAVAQMLGLYWWDKTAVPGVSYDYLLVADHDGSLGGDAETGLKWVETVFDFSVNDGFIAFNRAVTAAVPLAPPTDARAYALPGGTVAPDSGGPVIDATNNAGLTWDRKFAGDVLAADAPVIYHVPRADLGNSDAPADPADGDFKVLTEESPLPVGHSITSPPQVPQQPDEWPPFPLLYIDRGLPDGWYAYRVSAVDLFGRHSSRGASAAWRQWAPPPDPRPWYYVGASSDSTVHPSRIRLLDKIAPPPPAGVEAFALDPDDPTVLHDAAWQDWRNSLSAAEQADVVGLRVRWRWDIAQQRQAPDTREFRIYYTPAPLNTLRGRVTSTVAAGATETDVVTDIPNTQPAGAYVGVSVRIGAQSFKVVSSDAAATLRFRVKNIGPTDNVRPPSRTRCAVPIPAGHALYEDFGTAASWQQRMLVVDFGDHVQVDGAGNRSYEVLLPLAGSADRSGLPLTTSLEEPMSAAVIGVTATDQQQHTPDHRGDPARFGNESRIGGPATVFRVRRVKPVAPAVPPDSERVWASPADYHGHSLYTYRWLPAPHLKTLVYRALDDAVFQADLAQRPRPALQAGDLQFFPDEAVEPAWDALKRQQVASELNNLNGLDPTDRAAVRAAYGALSNDGLRVLAALPGTERVFVQLTHLALDPDEPEAGAPDGLRWRRVGADVASDALAAGQRAYVDTLDGKARNRYFYRCAYVDEVQNIGPLGLSSPPVWLPDVTPPSAPRVARVAAGDRQVTVEWTSNREPDLAEYRVYRTLDADAARDVRLMDLVHTVPVAPGDPAARPKLVTWTDSPVPGLRDIWYRLVAVDRVDPDPKGGGGNASAPSPAMRARAFDQTPPDPPALDTVEWVRVAGDGTVHAWADPVPAGEAWASAVRLEWPPDPDLRLLVQVRGEFDEGFAPASSWLPGGTALHLHRTDRTAETLEYRLKAVSAAGNANTVFHTSTLAPPA